MWWNSYLFVIPNLLTHRIVPFSAKGQSLFEPLELSWLIFPKPSMNVSWAKNKWKNQDPQNCCKLWKRNLQKKNKKKQQKTKNKKQRKKQQQNKRYAQQQQKQTLLFQRTSKQTPTKVKAVPDQFKVMVSKLTIRSAEDKKKKH